MKSEIQHMLQQGSGAIVNTASVAGLVGFPGLAAYTASKHAIVGLTKTAALEYAKAGIRINAVCPGAIRTPALDRFIARARQIETRSWQWNRLGAWARQKKSPRQSSGSALIEHPL